MPDSRVAPNESAERDAASHVALIDRYFECVATGDPGVADLLAEDIVWRAPASSPLQGPFEGRDAVLALMGSGVGLYDPNTPLDMRCTALAANGDRVFVEMEIRGRTRAGEAYENAYVFVFTVRDDRIVRVHEHLDTLYAQRKLFDPAGQRSPLG